MANPDFQNNKLIPVVAQDVASGKVLMLAYMNEQAYHETLSTRRVCYWSRSRRSLWRKGERSGNVQHLKHLFYDCDGDAILVQVEQVGGGACHEGFESCFYSEVNPSTGAATVVAPRVFDPGAVYSKA